MATTVSYPMDGAWEEMFTDPLSSLTDITGVSGTWSITGGVLRGTNTGAYAFARHSTPVHRHTVYIETEVRVPTAATIVYGGVVGRWNGTDTVSGGHELVALLQRDPATSGDLDEIRLGRSNAASSDAALPATLAVDTWHTLGAVMTHAGVTAFVNGTAVHTATFTPGEKAAHRVGFAAFNTVEFRNLRVLAQTLP